MEYALHHTEGVRGVFCVSPVLSLSVFPAAVLMLAKLLSRIVPRLTVDMGRRVDAGFDFVSHDPAFVKFIRQDPLRNAKLTPRWIAEVAAAVGRVDNQAANFPAPLLFLIAGADRAAPPEASKQFFQQVALQDKELHEYPVLYNDRSLLPGRWAFLSSTDNPGCGVPLAGQAYACPFNVCELIRVYTIHNRIQNLAQMPPSRVWP